MKVAVGSLRRPKIEAVQNVFAKALANEESEDNSVQCVPYQVDSGISDMPLSISELMRGARTRTLNLIGLLAESGGKTDYFVGLEGGLFAAGTAQARKAIFSPELGLRQRRQGRFLRQLRSCSGAAQDD